MCHILKIIVVVLIFYQIYFKEMNRVWNQFRKRLKVREKKEVGK